MATSTVGSVRYKIYGALLLVNTVVLGLSAHINHFQDFFYVADAFPFLLSLITAVFVVTMLALDSRSWDAFTARPPFELGWLFVFGILWLSFNAFSTTRWRYITMDLCKSIPSGAQYEPYQTWCHELVALRAFVWIEWVLFVLTFAFLLRWAITQHNNGRRDVWTTSFSRFTAREQFHNHVSVEFLQWEKFPPSAPADTGVAY